MFNAYFPFFFFFFGDFAILLTSMHNTQMLASFPNCKKIVMCFMEKIHVLDMLCLGMGAIGCMFSVNESAIYIM